MIDNLMTSATLLIGVLIGIGAVHYTPVAFTAGLVGALAAGLLTNAVRLYLAVRRSRTTEAPR